MLLLNPLLVKRTVYYIGTELRKSGKMRATLEENNAATAVTCCAQAWVLLTGFWNPWLRVSNALNPSLLHVLNTLYLFSKNGRNAFFPFFQASSSMGCWLESISLTHPKLKAHWKFKSFLCAFYAKLWYLQFLGFHKLHCKFIVIR